MYVYYKIGTRSFQLRPLTFSTMQRYIKNPNLRKEKKYFFFIAAPMCLF